MCSNEIQIDHEIVIIIYLQEENKWAVYNKERLYFPITSFCEDLTITESAIKYIKELINSDLRMIKIDNIGFVDTIQNKKELTYTSNINKELLMDGICNKKISKIIISFGFLVQIFPGTHIDSQLEFLTYDEIRNAISRISENHFKLFRKSIGYISHVPIFTK